MCASRSHGNGHTNCIIDTTLTRWHVRAQCFVGLRKWAVHSLNFNSANLKLLSFSRQPYLHKTKVDAGVISIFITVLLHLVRQRWRWSRTLISIIVNTGVTRVFLGRMAVVKKVSWWYMLQRKSYSIFHTRFSLKQMDQHNTYLYKRRLQFQATLCFVFFK